MLGKQAYFNILTPEFHKIFSFLSVFIVLAGLGIHWDQCGICISHATTTRVGIKHQTCLNISQLPHFFDDLLNV